MSRNGKGHHGLGTCLRVSIAVERHHDHSLSYKGKGLIEAVAYSFRGLAHYHHGGEHSRVQADGVLEKDLLHVDVHAGNRK